MTWVARRSDDSSQVLVPALLNPRQVIPAHHKKNITGPCSKGRISVATALEIGVEKKQ